VTFLESVRRLCWWGERYSNPWQANTLYAVGDIVTAVPDNGHIFKLVQVLGPRNFNGNSQPAWNTQPGAQTTDNQVIWQEYGASAYPSLLRISEADQPGVYLGDTGFVQVAENNGQRVTAVFEFSNQIFAAKEHSIYLVTPNTSSPATWDVREAIAKAGVCGPRAVDKTAAFVFFVERAGAYVYNGGAPERVSDELNGYGPDRPGVWDRINWNYAHLIWVAIDPDSFVVRIGVPLDNATEPSHVLKVSYRDGWEPSLRFSPFTARFHYHPGRRWSIDEIAASQAVKLERTQALTGVVEDQRLTTTQVILGASDGSVHWLDPAAIYDNGQPFRAYYLTGGLSPKTLAQQPPAGVSLLDIVQLNARGEGKLSVSARLTDGTEEPVGDVDLGDAPIGDYMLRPAFIQSERIGLKFSNPPASGGRWHVKAAYCYLRPLYGTRLI
jgi:hypothetical protein